MANIRVPQGRSVQSRALPTTGGNLRTQPEDFGAGIGRSLGKAGDVATDIYTREKEKADTTAIMSADRRLSEAQNEILYGENGALNAQGRNALGISDSGLERLEERAEEIRGELSNESQRAAFEQMLQRRRQQAQSQLMRHERAQLKSYRENETAAYISNAQRSAALNYNDPDIVQTELQRQQNALKLRADEEGWSPEQYQQALAQAQARTHTAVLDRMLAKDDYQAARQYLGRYRDQVPGDVLAAAEKAIDTGNLRASAQQATDAIMADGLTLQEALAEARAIEDPELRDETVKRVKMRFNERESVRKEQDRAIRESAFDTIEQGGSVDDIPAQNWLALSNADRQALERRQRQVQEGIEPTTDWERYYKLTQLATSQDPKDRRRFADTNLLQYRDKLADAEFKELVSAQRALRGDQTADAADLEWVRTKSQMVTEEMEAAGLDPNPDPNTTAAAQKSAFLSRLQNRVTLYQQANNGTKPTPEQFRDMARSLLRDVTINEPPTNIMGFEVPFTGGDTERRLFEVYTPYEEIPEGDRRAAERLLRRDGRPPTEAAVEELYMQYQMETGGGSGQSQ